MRSSQEDFQPLAARCTSFLGIPTWPHISKPHRPTENSRPWKNTGHERSHGTPPSTMWDERVTGPRSTWTARIQAFYTVFPWITKLSLRIRKNNLKDKKANMWTGHPVLPLSNCVSCQISEFSVLYTSPDMTLQLMLDIHSLSVGSGDDAIVSVGPFSVLFSGRNVQYKQSWLWTTSGFFTGKEQLSQKTSDGKSPNVPGTECRQSVGRAWLRGNALCSTQNIYRTWAAWGYGVMLRKSICFRRVKRRNAFGLS